MDKVTQFANRDYLEKAYGSDDALRIRIETQKHYQQSRRNIFDELTYDALVLCSPKSILDIGAGTGSWYETIRRIIGDGPVYHGIDQSPAMVASLNQRLSHDTRASADVAEVGALPYAPESFDWVGMHFMLYHVPDIGGALQEAWSLVKPGGLLLTATNGFQSYAEMHAMHAQASRLLNLPYHDEARGDRFSLKNGAAYFPEDPHLVEFPAGLRFPTLESFLAYYGSGFCWNGLPQDRQMPEVRENLLHAVGNIAAPRLQQDGVITLSQTHGYFWLQKV